MALGLISRLKPQSLWMVQGEKGKREKGEKYKMFRLYFPFSPLGLFAFSPKFLRTGGGWNLRFLLEALDKGLQVDAL